MALAIFPQEKFANDLKAYKDGRIGRDRILSPEKSWERIVAQSFSFFCFFRDLGLGLKPGKKQLQLMNVHHEAATWPKYVWNMFQMLALHKTHEAIDRWPVPCNVSTKGWLSQTKLWVGAFDLSVRLVGDESLTPRKDGFCLVVTWACTSWGLLRQLGSILIGSLSWIFFHFIYDSTNLSWMIYVAASKTYRVYIVIIFCEHPLKYGNLMTGATIRTLLHGKSTLKIDRYCRISPIFFRVPCFTWLWQTLNEILVHRAPAFS